MVQRTMTDEAISMIGPAELEDIRLDLEAEEQTRKAKAQPASQVNDNRVAARFPTTLNRLKKSKVVTDQTASEDRHRDVYGRTADPDQNRS